MFEDFQWQADPIQTSKANGTNVCWPTLGKTDNKYWTQPVLGGC